MLFLGLRRRGHAVPKHVRKGVDVEIHALRIAEWVASCGLILQCAQVLHPRVMRVPVEDRLAISVGRRGAVLVLNRATKLGV